MSYIVEPYQQKLLNDIKKKQKTKNKVVASSLVPRKQPKQKRKVAKKKAAKQESTTYTKRKLCITPVELSQLTNTAINYSIFGANLSYEEAGIAAANRLNMSQLFGRYVGAALGRDLHTLHTFTGVNKGRGRIKNSA